MQSRATGIADHILPLGNLLNVFCDLYSHMSGSNRKREATNLTNDGLDSPVTEIEQLVAEMAVVCESRKAVLNIASTFKDIIKRLHWRGYKGVDWLKNM